MRADVARMADRPARVCSGRRRRRDYCLGLVAIPDTNLKLKADSVGANSQVLNQSYRNSISRGNTLDCYICFGAYRYTMRRQKEGHGIHDIRTRQCKAQASHKTYSAVRTPMYACQILVI